MISQAQYLNIIAIVIATCAAAVGQQSKESANINIPLNKGVTWTNKELYSDFIHINRSSTIQVVFTDVNKNVSFVIFQVHSHLYNITVYNNSFVSGSYISGTNVGLYSSVKPNIDTFYILNPNSDVDLNLFISVHGYMSKDPIPGGCNMEFPIPVSPFMNTDFQKDFILVDAAPAKRYDDKVCIQGDSVNVDFFMMYLPERNFEEETYFDGIRNMMTVEKIRENGDRIPKSKWPMRRMLSAYPGTGSVYVAVASNVNSPDSYSIYVPTHNYACSPVTDDGCELIEDTLSRFICASLLFVGVFMCYFGHRFFKTEMFLFGMLSGVVITYILISLISQLDSPALLSAAVLSGVFFGAIWLTFWWFYGIPVIAVLIPALNMGFLMSSVIYNKFPGDLIVLQEDFNFWTLFILIMLLTSMILVSVAYVSNILCCAVLGAYAVVFPIDCYLGSSLKYLVINTIRRATVPKFSRAVLMPPFEWRDATMIVLWVALAVSGFLFQHLHNRSRPPFPPPPRSVRPAMPEGSIYGALPTTRNFVSRIHVSSPVVVRSMDERTPLLS